MSQTEETISTVGEAMGGALESSALPRRPAIWLSALFDGMLAVAAYLGAYSLRFSGGELRAFLSGAWSTAPIVVISQLVALAALGAYGRRPRLDWLLRVICGILAGTAAASTLVALSRGLEGLSRSAFVADAMLLSIAALVWRGVWVLRARARARGDGGEAVGDLVDRSAEMTTIKRRHPKPLQLPRTSQEPGPQGHQAEVPRLGLRLPLVTRQPAVDDRGLHDRVHVHPAGPQRGLRLLSRCWVSCRGRSFPALRPCRLGQSSTTPGC